ncbi:MAG TPA: HAD family hydrolase [Burkholderiales bacterium]
MRFTAIALDYDGTIARDGAVAPHVLEGLRRLQESGRKLLLVTGRELEELLRVFPGIGIFDRVVAENGALYYRPDTGERRELATPPPEALIAALKTSGVPLAIGHTILATVRPNETAVLQCIADQGLEHQVIFNKGAVMVLPPGCNKASGLKFALADLGLSPHNLVAAGDGENDHALLEMAEYSVATANAVPMLKKTADLVTVATHGDGILEVVAALLDSDLAALPPRRQRHLPVLGTDWLNAEVKFPEYPGSILLAGRPSDTDELAMTLLRRICNAQYQFCVLDRRGHFLGFKPAIIFGTPENPPALEEISTALEKPDAQCIVCMAAVPDQQQYLGRLQALLGDIRTRLGRPHWILIDETRGAAAKPEMQQQVWPGEGNSIFISEDPAALERGVLASFDVIAASGPDAAPLLRTFAAELGEAEPALPGRPPGEGEALVWFRKLRQPVALLDLR